MKYAFVTLIVVYLLTAYGCSPEKESAVDDTGTQESSHVTAHAGTEPPAAETTAATPTAAGAEAETPVETVVGTAAPTETITATATPAAAVAEEETTAESTAGTTAPPETVAQTATALTVAEPAVPTATVAETAAPAEIVVETADEVVVVEPQAAPNIDPESDISAAGNSSKPPEDIADHRADAKWEKVVEERSRQVLALAAAAEAEGRRVTMDSVETVEAGPACPPDDSRPCRSPEKTAGDIAAATANSNEVNRALEEMREATRELVQLTNRLAEENAMLKEILHRLDEQKQ